MKKKFSTAMAVVLLAGALAACGNTDGQPGNENENQTAEDNSGISGENSAGTNGTEVSNIGDNGSENDSSEQDGEADLMQPETGEAEVTPEANSTPEPTQAPEPVELSDGIYDIRGTVRGEVFADKLTYILQEHIFPDGDSHGFEETYDMSENRFAVCDIDRDGQIELLIQCMSPYMAGMAEWVLDYYEAPEEFIEELLDWPSLTFYDNGLVIAEASHNHTYSDVWPYAVYLYSVELDSYDIEFHVHAWDKSVTDVGMLDGEEIPFPDEIDLDGDGIVYYVESEYYAETTPIDGAAYISWQEEQFGGARELLIPWHSLTEEEIGLLR